MRSRQLPKNCSTVGTYALAESLFMSTASPEPRRNRIAAAIIVIAAVCTILGFQFDLFAYFFPSVQSAQGTTTSADDPSDVQATTSPATTDTATSPPSVPPLPTATFRPAAAQIDATTITDARIEIKGLQENHLGVDLYDADAEPDYETFVYTEAGRLEGEGCYVAWAVYNNDVLMDTSRTGCAKKPGWGGPYWPRLTYDPGAVLVTADITTDAGAQFHAEVSFQMIDQ
jgi:hypothetical protein